MTNSGSFKRKMELPKNNFERVYKVKIQGFIDNKFINTLLRGYTYKKVKYKPIKASFISKTNTYSWIKMTLTEGKNKEIRNNATSFYGIFILLILLLTLITPYASSSPDGLESVAESYGFNEESGIVLFLDDYGITNINNNFLSTVLSAVLGIVVIVVLFNIYIKVKNKN